MQDFGSIAAEVRRFRTFATTSVRDGTDGRARRPRGTGARSAFTAERARCRSSCSSRRRGDRALALARTPAAADAARSRSAGAELAPAREASRRDRSKRRSTAARRRNLVVSSSILAVLGASVGLLVLSTRRAQTLARQQMEFVAAVSHELRTPLAVIRSAGENLADGVVRDEAQIRKYGELVRNEGRRLTEMVEQILEFAGIQSGQRGFALRPVGVRAVCCRTSSSRRRTLIEAAGSTVECDVPPAICRRCSATRRRCGACSRT